MTTATRRRPPVSVIVPFLGGPEVAHETLEALAALELRAGDEVLLADNTEEGVLKTVASGRPVEVVHAGAERSSYHARNVGAERAANDWLLFVDADCRPGRALLDNYFEDPIDAGCGMVSGPVTGMADQSGRMAGYASSRRHLDQVVELSHSHRPAAVTANLLVRRQVWAEVGGFLEGIRSGGDTDFCWRAQEIGWSLAHAPRAVVEHRHRERVGTLSRQMGRYGAGRAWINRRHGGALGRPAPVRGLLRCAAGVLGWSLTARFERALFKAIDAIVLVAYSAGYLLDNSAPSRAATAPPGPRNPAFVTLVDLFPALSETFVAEEAHALKRLGAGVRVEASGRPLRPNRERARGIAVSYSEDEGPAGKLGALAWLFARHPLRCAFDVASRRRWRREEPVRPLRSLAPRARRLARGGERHLHAHFAAGAALDALRLGRLLDLPYSVTAHAYDIFQRPRNLAEKLEGAAFVTTGCEYNAVHLRRLIGAPGADRIHTMIMGVDGERFRRRSPYAGGRTVIAIGRLVEKKGFEHLIDAAAELQARAPLERVWVVGAGPLHTSLLERVASRGLGDVVELLGPRDPDEVRELLERADVLAMPCVVAADGDRDSMPVVVKEALAMEIPVVASDEVGLPELVKPGWGRLVTPGDAGGLAEALAEVLALSPDERAAMGRRGREWVLQHCDVEREAERLALLVCGARG
jgi:colanic acid/amylovoran biosynthesis glycosyltransferase